MSFFTEEFPMGSHCYPILKAEEAAEFIQNGDLIAFGGFTPSGAPKKIPFALAKKANLYHDQNKAFQIRLITGASIGSHADDILADANAISWRAPYQTSLVMNNKINNNQVHFNDLNLSDVSRMVSAGVFGKINIAVVEATHVSSDGKIYLTNGIGNAPVFIENANKVIIEINNYHRRELSELSDIIYTDEYPPTYQHIPIFNPMDRPGKNYIQVDPQKILGIVENDEPDDVREFKPETEIHREIAENVSHFLLGEMAKNRLPQNLFPIQSGVGNINNAVLRRLGENPHIPPFFMYSEVLQDSVIELMQDGKVVGASGSSLTISGKTMDDIYNDFSFFKKRLVLRPLNISNSPEIIRRLCVIAINVGLEIDIYGHVNSTHIAGTKVMNGIGGSGDFSSNAYLSIFIAPSMVKNCTISTIVPMCTHIDHNEHNVDIIITENGIADLRGLSPIMRSKTIIDNCAHPDYRDILNQYVMNAKVGHLPHNLDEAFRLYQNLHLTGSMI